MKVIIISSLINDKHVKMIESAASKVGAELRFVSAEDKIPEDFKDAEVIYGFGINTAKTSMNLKWLSVPSAGVDYLMKPESFANDKCILTSSSGSYGVTIAEHIITVSLMMMRRLDYTYRETLKGVWSSPQPQKSLKNCRITVLGTGDIGTCFAKRAKAFEPANIIGVCRSGKSEAPYYDKVMAVSELDEILPETDLLVMSLPATAETENILSKERIALLPKGAYVVNVGRGTAIDEEAIADSLDAGKIGGAALDVFRNEPLPKESRLWNTKNLLITPHVAGNLTLEHTLDTNVSQFCDNLIKYAQGQPMNHVVDRRRGY